MTHTWTRLTKPKQEREREREREGQDLSIEP